MWTTKDLEQALNINISFDITANGVSIDSRNIEKGNIFISIKGEVYNGEDFAYEALDKGAALCIVSTNFSLKEEAKSKTIQVADPYQALLQLGLYKRKKINPKVIGITGSVGKTSTKEMLVYALEDQYEIHYSRGNYNNHIGMPLTMANMPEKTEVLILEMGMSAEGEISFLSKLSEPDIAIITNVEVAHLEFFDSLSHIATAKASIVDGMKENEGVLILNTDNPNTSICKKIAEQHNIYVCSYGKKDADIVLQNMDIDINNEISSVEVSVYKKTYNYKLNLVQEHLIFNSLAVIATIRTLGADVLYSLKALMNFKPISGRGKIYKLKNITLIDDAYNASPAAVSCAIATLAKFAGKKLAILGDMLELGANSRNYHEELNNDLIKHKIDLVITVGKMMEHLFTKLPSDRKHSHYENVDQLIKDIENISKLADVMLVKASKSIRLYEFVKEMTSAS